MEFLESIHNILLPAHIIGVTATLAIVFSADFYGFLWIIGKKQTLSSAVLHKLHIGVWAGLLCTALAGLGMFLPYYEYLLTDPAFRIKMMLILFLLINAFVIRHHMYIPTQRPFSMLTMKERMPLILSGAVSMTGWIGALIAAQFIGL